MGHVLGADEGVEFFGGYEAELNGRFAWAHDFVGRELWVFGGGAQSGPVNVVGDLQERGGEVFQGAAGENDFVVRGKRGKFVGMRAEGQAGELGDFLCGALGKFGMSVEAGTDGGAADGEIVE